MSIKNNTPFDKAQENRSRKSLAAVLSEPYRRLRVLLLATTYLTLNPFPFNFFSAPVRTITIMLEPAGDTRQPGRQIGNEFERTLTWHCVESIKKILEEKHNNLNVIITRHPGDTINPLQNAQFANQQNIDLYVSINFYYDQTTKPTLYLYQFWYGDNIISKPGPIGFISYDQAYLQNTTTTHKYAMLLHKNLQEADYKKQFECKGPFKLPCKPLIGITAPAFMIEAGLKDANAWKLYSESIAHSLNAIIKVLNP